MGYSKDPRARQSRCLTLALERLGISREQWIQIVNHAQQG
jgi:hypothetical protein